MRMEVPGNNSRRLRIVLRINLPLYVFFGMGIGWPPTASISAASMARFLDGVS